MIQGRNDLASENNCLTRAAPSPPTSNTKCETNTKDLQQVRVESALSVGRYWRELWSHYGLLAVDVKPTNLLVRSGVALTVTYPTKYFEGRAISSVNKPKWAHQCVMRQQQHGGMCEYSVGLFCFSS